MLSSRIESRRSHDEKLDKQFETFADPNTDLHPRIRHRLCDRINLGRDSRKWSCICDRWRRPRQSWSQPQYRKVTKAGMGVSVLIECWLAGFQDMPCDRKIDQHHGISKQQLRGAPAAPPLSPSPPEDFLFPPLLT